MPPIEHRLDTYALPTQASPPEFALSALGPHAIRGVEAMAVPVLPHPDGDAVLLGPGAAEIAEESGIDLLGVLELHEATGKAGEVASVPIPLGGSENPDLRWVH